MHSRVCLRWTLASHTQICAIPKGLGKWPFQMDLGKANSERNPAQEISKADSGRELSKGAWEMNFEGELSKGAWEREL
jgi:hypothetical protein